MPVGVPDLDLEELTRWVRDRTVAQGRYVLSQWPALPGLRYKDGRDVVTEVDLEVERNLRADLRRRFPHHGFHGEETGSYNPRARFQWLVDPLDGTKYYAGFASLFSVSVGLLRGGEPILGVIYDVTARHCFSAYSAGGAFLDDRELSGSRVAELDRVIANVETPGSDRLSAAERDWFEARWTALSRHLYRVRSLGQSSLAACWVATGALDAYLDLTGYALPQDTAAARLVMSEAGMRVGYVDVGVGPPRLVGAPPAVFPRLVELLDGREVRDARRPQEGRPS